MRTTFTKTKINANQLLIVKTNKFKTELLTAAMSLPYEPRSSMLCSLLFSVLKQGCKEYPSPQYINCRLDDLYDSTIGTAYSPIGENATATVISEWLDEMYIPDRTPVMGGTLEVLSKMLTEPLLDENGFFLEDIVANEKKALCDKIRAADNNPKSRSQRLCLETMFASEPYANRILGSADAINAVTPRCLTEFYYEFLKSSSLQFVYVGSRGEEIIPIIDDVFSGIGGKPSKLNETIIKKANREIRFVSEEMAVTQGKLTFGFRSDIDFFSEDIYPAMLLNDIFGGSPSSKLFRNVREANSLCYSCSSTYDFAKGAIFVCSGIANENKDRVVGEILRQFEKIQKGEVSDYEFECSKKAIVNYYMQANDSAYSIENFYRQRMLYGMQITLEETVKKLMALKKEDVINVALRFAPDTCAFVKGTLADKAFEEEDEGTDE